MRTLRSTEWLLIGYFSYVALLSPTRLPLSVLLLAIALVAVLAVGESRGNPLFFSIARDWAPLVLTLIAYREMDWFTPLAWDHHLEFRWIAFDRSLLYGWGFQRAIESVGALLPTYLEFCYLLVYAVGPFTVAVLYLEHRRNRVNQVLLLYLLGTLLAYALFPFFLSQPPRTLFGDSDLPTVMTALRRINLWIVNGYGIHSSVFPSAHVSSAFSAGWALLLYLPDRKRYGVGMLIYAASVSVAAVYGRYHYAVDVLAGCGVSVIAAGIVLAANKRE
ncbi:MAG: phosphatase PAP2 family protein [Bryobacteraceae bacterium]